MQNIYLFTSFIESKGTILAILRKNMDHLRNYRHQHCIGPIVSSKSKLQQQLSWLSSRSGIFSADRILCKKLSQNSNWWQKCSSFNDFWRTIFDVKVSVRTRRFFSNITTATLKLARLEETGRKNGQNLRLFVQIITHWWFGRWQNLCSLSILRGCI